MPQLQKVIRKEQKKQLQRNIIVAKKNILKFSKSIANAAVEADQEIFNKEKFEYIDVVDKTYDHSKNVNYHVKEVKNDTLKEKKLLKKNNCYYRQEKKMMQEKLKKNCFKNNNTKMIRKKSKMI